MTTWKEDPIKWQNEWSRKNRRRIGMVVHPEVAELLEKLAAERGLSKTQYVTQLVLEDQKRRQEQEQEQETETE